MATYLPWIEAEFGMGKSTAYKFMDVAKLYRSKLPPGGNLELSDVYELAAPKTPLEVREEVEKMIEAGEVVTKATFQEVRAKLSGLEKAKTLAEQEIEEKAAKVADLDENIYTAPAGLT